MYNEAFSECHLTGDTTNTEACAISTSFAESLASACASATADAMAAISAKDCACDLTAYLEVSAWAKVYKRVFASVEQQVEAYACDAGPGASPAKTSEIRRECTVNVVAASLAQVRASATPTAD